MSVLNPDGGLLQGKTSEASPMGVIDHSSSVDYREDHTTASEGRDDGPRSVTPLKGRKLSSSSNSNIQSLSAADVRGQSRQGSITQHPPSQTTSDRLTTRQSESRGQDVSSTSSLAFHQDEPTLNSHSEQQPKAVNSDVGREPRSTRTRRALQRARAALAHRKQAKDQLTESLRAHRQSTYAQEATFFELLGHFLDGDTRPAAVELRAQRETLQERKQQHSSMEEGALIEEAKFDEAGKEVDKLWSQFLADTEDGGTSSPNLPQRSPPQRPSPGGSFSLHGGSTSPTTNVYWSLLGDRDLIMEKLSELRAERASLEDQRSARAAHGLALDDDSVQVLAEFDQIHTRYMDQLSAVERELDTLQTSTHETRYHPIDESNEKYTAYGFEDLAPQSEQSANLDPADKTLFRSLTLTERPPASSDMVIDMSQFINEWLLENLWLSDREKKAYLNIFRDETSIIPSDSLGQVISETWYKDDMEDIFLMAQKRRSWDQGLSDEATLDDTMRNMAQSDAQPIRRRRNLPLLQLNKNIDAATIIARAQAEQASSRITEP